MITRKEVKKQNFVTKKEIIYWFTLHRFFFFGICKQKLVLMSGKRGYKNM